MSKIILSKSIQELMSKEAMGKTIASVSVSAFSQGPEVYTGIVITGYSITGRNGHSYGPKDFDLVGWNDSTSDWDILDSRRGESFANAEKRYYDVMVSKVYKKFRINILSGNSTTYVNIGDLQFYNLDVPLVPNLTGGVITGQTSTLNGYTVSASSSWNSTYLAWKAFNGTVSVIEDTWNSADGKVAGEWLEIDFGNNLDNYARIPYVIISQGKQSIPITGSTNTVAVTQSGLQLAQDIAINNTSNTSITHLVFEYTDKFNTKIGYSILPLATPIKSSEKVTFTQPIIPFNTIPNSSSDFELASYYSYTQPVFKDDIILSTSRHALKSFFRNMVDVNTPHTFQTNLIVADNLSGAFGDNRDSLLTSDFTTVPSVNLITMAGVDDTDDLRDTDLTQDKKIFRSKFMNRNFMYVKDHGFYGIKVELDSSVDVSGIQVITQEMNGFTIKLINVTSGYNVYVASTAEPIIRIDGSNIFIHSATKADDLMVAVGDALGELAPFVDRMQELKNVYQNQVSHGDIITKSYTVMIDSTQHVLTTESGVYKSPNGDIPTQILEYNGDTYVQVYNQVDVSTNTIDRYIDPNLNLRLWDQIVFPNDTMTVDFFSIYSDGSTSKQIVTLANKIVGNNKITASMGGTFDTSIGGNRFLSYFNSILNKSTLTKSVVGGLPVYENVDLKVTASSVYRNTLGYEQISAFDNNRETTWLSGEVYSTTGSEYIEVELLSGLKTPNQYTISPGMYGIALQSWKLECMNSDGGWVLLDQQLDQTLTNYETREIPFTNTTPSSKFRVTVLKSGSAYASIGNFNLFEYTPQSKELIDSAIGHSTPLKQLFVKVHEQQILKGNYLRAIDVIDYNIDQTRTIDYITNSSFDAYVSPYGSDVSGNGTIDSPYKTITKAVAVGARVVGLLPGIYDELDYGALAADAYTTVHNLFPSNISTFNQSSDYKLSNKILWNDGLEYFYSTSGVKKALYVSSVYGKDSVVVVTRQGTNGRDYPIMANTPNTIIANVTIVRYKTTRTENYSNALSRSSSSSMFYNVRFVIENLYSLVYVSTAMIYHSCTFEPDNKLTITLQGNYSGSHVIVN